jgi:hypothetical protein
MRIAQKTLILFGETSSFTRPQAPGG